MLLVLHIVDDNGSSTAASKQGLGLNIFGAFPAFAPPFPTFLPHPSSLHGSMSDCRYGCDVEEASPTTIVSIVPLQL